MNQTLDPESTQNQPLSGIRVLVTRPGNGPDSLAEELEKLGAIVTRYPLIEFSEPPDVARVRRMGSQLDRFGMLVFLSPRAAAAADEYFLTPARPNPSIAAIGQGTSTCLASLGYEVSFTPQESNSESMAELLIERFKTDRSSKPILILRADRGSDVLPLALAKAEVLFEELAVYQSHDVTQVDPKILQQLADGKFDWVTVTSSSIARTTANLFGDSLAKTKVVSISPTTSAAAKEAGISVAAEATEYNTNGMVNAIVKHHAEL